MSCVFSANLHHQCGVHSYRGKTHTFNTPVCERLHSVFFAINLRSILTPLHCFFITGLPTPSSPTIEKKPVADVTEFDVPFAATRSSVDDEYRLRRVVPQLLSYVEPPTSVLLPPLTAHSFTDVRVSEQVFVYNCLHVCLFMCVFVYFAAKKVYTLKIIIIIISNNRTEHVFKLHNL